MDKFLIVLGGIVIAIISIIFDAFVLTKLWDWFIVTLFNLPHLNLAYAYGITLMINYLKGYKKSDEIKEKMSVLLLGVFIRSGIVLLIGYIVFQFI
jgi:hypothetical protein